MRGEKPKKVVWPATGLGEVPLAGGGRKDHVLQTRVTKGLYNDLVVQARRLRVPVSNLVRNILEDSFRIVENIVDNSLDIAQAIGGKMDENALASVMGWQPMIANRQLACAHCQARISKGDEAFTSVGAPGGRLIVICKECECRL